ncbi:ribonuclease P protein component [Candidatus Saccharibacteria bacterium]|jgi:ribonuclease P protein component|nr:ribonuclease P protein component [Candidatus Saccharibacteria bacterium]QCT40268.1 ribonuclease P protein component [Candidatus Saccharibacteria bacterium oral taxon 955]QHU89897.1 ribonuclease P protein component [Candidatus Saccharibacteria bacterium oral taxon 955]QHU91692.1 ribonuclease P protein component [Candidatus Saccharibacteria bacterium oral taxon 955]QJU06270.1 ribonuclease P protein component [Candidatus Saccharibacteria bacterium oral taxon 955]
MLSASLRFHGHGSLRFLYKNASAYRSRLMTLKIVANPYRKLPRVSVVVSKKVHKSAVGRNRIRRRLYEIMRHELPRLNGVYDIAIIVTNGEVLSAEHIELQSAVRDLLSQAKAL